MAVAKFSPNYPGCLLAIFSGAAGVFAYSPFDYWFVAYFSAFGLLYVATQPARGRALRHTFLWALSYFCVGVHWVSVSMTQFGGVPEAVSYLAVLLLGAYLALYPLLFCYVSQRFQWQNPWALAALWTLCEYLRGVVFTGFPWLQFGYSQIDSPFAGVAPLLGVEGLSFLVIVLSGYAVQAVRRTRISLVQWSSLALAVILAVASQWWTFVQPANDKPAITVSLVQGNIEQKMKWDPAHFDFSIQTYQQLLQPLWGKSDLIILPESALPALEEYISPIFAQLDQVASQSGSEVIIGSLNRYNGELFNSALVLGNAQAPYTPATAARYNKHHLVPFGEYVPFGNLLDWMREVFILPVNLAQGDFIQPPLLAKNLRFTLAICYEIIFGDQVQQNQRAQNADYLVTISNDAWFGASIGPWQHFQMARMRALELGRPLLRATNTGITAFVDPFGKVTAQANQFEATVLTAPLQPVSGDTLFSRFGNRLIYLFSAFVLAACLWRRTRLKQ